MSKPQTLTLTLDMLTPLFVDGQSIRAARDLKPEQFSGLRASADGTYLIGDCQGSEAEPYRVTADLAGGRGRFDCECSSPKYPCKHVLGLLMQRVGRPGAFAEVVPLDGDRDRLTARGRRSLPLSVPPPAAPPDPNTDSEAILRGVAEAPDDDAPRLVYADWLEEHGGPDGAPRAELIRLQCRAARTPPGPEAEALEGRIGKLIDRHRPRWMADVPPHLRGKVRFVRGFLGCLEMPPAYLLKHGPGLAERLAITEVRLTAAPDTREASRLAVSPVWARVTTLTLSQGVGERRALELLLSSPYLTALRDLRVWAGGEGREGVSLPHVEHLVRSGALGRLHRLDLSGNSLNDRSLAALLAGEPAGLRELVLDDNPLGNDGVAVLSAWPAPALEALSLANCGVGPRGVEALRTAPWLGRLRRLNLSGNRLTAAGARALTGL